MRIQIWTYLLILSIYYLFISSYVIEGKAKTIERTTINYSSQFREQFYKNNYYNEEKMNGFYFIIPLILISITLLIYIRRSEMKYKKMALTDEITNYGNYNQFKILTNDILAKNKVKQYALVYFDIDKFKLFNDYFGVDEGNSILICISDILYSNLQDNELFARINADHFVVLLNYEMIDQLVKRIRAISEQTINIYKKKVKNYQLNFSAGIYIMKEKEVNIVDCVDKANIARKSIKDHSQKKIIFYNETLQEDIIMESKIENLMETALQRNEFLVYFQPKYDLETLKLAGVEALVRWNSNELGFLSPNQFIPIFEKNGFIQKLDFYVLSICLKWLKKEMEMKRELISISVNQSRAHFNNPDYIKQLKELIDLYELPAFCIELEITESIFWDNNELIQVLDEVRKMGFLISIDDFGSGFSSLNVLKDIPVDVLKIDKMFLDETKNSKRSQIIVKNVVDMAKELDMKVVCEGVETAEQVKFLQQIHCDLAQGFYYAKPMEMDEFNKLKRNA